MGPSWRESRVSGDTKPQLTQDQTEPKNHQFSRGRLTVTIEGFPSDLVDGFVSLVGAWLDLAPGWCEHLSFVWDDDPGDNDLAVVNVNTPYAQARVWIAPAFFARTEREKSQALVHELIHININPAIDYAIRELKRVCEDDRLNESICSELQDKTERAVQDQSRAVIRMTGGGAGQ